MVCRDHAYRILFTIQLELAASCMDLRENYSNGTRSA